MAGELTALFKNAKQIFTKEETPEPFGEIWMTEEQTSSADMEYSETGVCPFCGFEMSFILTGNEIGAKRILVFDHFDDCLLDLSLSHWENQ